MSNVLLRSLKPSRERFTGVLRVADTLETAMVAKNLGISYLCPKLFGCHNEVNLACKTFRLLKTDPVNTHTYIYMYSK